MKKYFLLTAILAFAIYDIEAQPLSVPKQIRAKGDYSHLASGAVFPEQIDNYKRTDITAFDKKKTDICAGYELEAPTGKTTATVYVYPAGKGADQRFRREYMTCLQAIAIAYKKDITPSQTYSPYTKEGYKVNGFKAYTYISSKDRSLLQLYECGRWFLKLRISSDYLDSVSLSRLGDQITERFNPVNLVKRSPLRLNTECIIAKEAFRDTMALRGALMNAMAAADWIEKNIDSMERISGLNDLYLDMYMASLKESSNIMGKVDSSTASEESILYRKQLRSLIDNDYLDEFVMYEFGNVMIIPEGKTFDIAGYYAWRASNPISFNLFQRMYYISEGSGKK